MSHRTYGRSVLANGATKMQPMFLDGVWKKFDELAEAAFAQPAARRRTAPSSSAFTAAILLPASAHPKG